MRNQAPIEKLTPREKLKDLSVSDERQLTFIDPLPDSIKEMGHGLDFPKDEDRARQDKRHETEVDRILAQHGGIPIGSQRPVYGVVDFSLTLQEGLHAQAESRDAWQRIPADIRKEYVGWEHLLTAINKGDLLVKEGQLVRKEPAKPAGGETPPAPPK